jgi:hypothetical protein
VTADIVKCVAVAVVGGV